MRFAGDHWKGEFDRDRKGPKPAKEYRGAMRNNAIKWHGVEVDRVVEHPILVKVVSKKGEISYKEWDKVWEQLRNKFEKRIERQLKRAKVKFKYENERIPYVLAGHYVPDFVIQTPTGLLYVECKGYLRPEHKRKMVAVKKQHPNLDIRILWYSHRPSNIRWAERYGFRWAIETIPREWLLGEV